MLSALPPILDRLLPLIIMEIKKDTTIIFTTHDMDLAYAYGDSIYRILPYVEKNTGNYTKLMFCVI